MYLLLEESHGETQSSRGLAVLALSLFLLSGTAFAHATHHKKAKPNGESGGGGPLKRASCTRCPRRSWTRASSRTPRASPTSSKSSAKKSTPRSTSGSAPTSSTAVATKSSTGAPVRGLTTVDGSRRAELHGRTRQRRQRHGDRARWASCAAGESLISAHLESAPFTTVTTVFTVLPPRPTSRACSPPPRARSRTRPPAASRRSSRSSSRRCSPRNPSTSNFAQLFARCHEDPKTEVIVDGRDG